MAWLWDQPTLAVTARRFHRNKRWQQLSQARAKKRSTSGKGLQNSGRPRDPRSWTTKTNVNSFFSAYITSGREYKFDRGLNNELHLKCVLNNRHHIRLVLSKLRDILFYCMHMIIYVLKLIIINPKSCFFLLLFQLFFKKKHGKIKEIFWPEICSESAFLKLFIYLFYFLYTTAAMMRHALKPFPVSFQR